MNMLDQQTAARRRLAELAASFSHGGPGELRGEALADAVQTELAKLPVVAAEIWLSVHGWRYRMAIRPSVQQHAAHR